MCRSRMIMILRYKLSCKGKDHFLDQVQWLRMKNRVKVHNAIMDTWWKACCLSTTDKQQVQLSVQATLPEAAEHQGGAADHQGGTATGNVNSTCMVSGAFRKGASGATTLRTSCTTTTETTGWGTFWTTALQQRPLGLQIADRAGKVTFKQYLTTY